MIHRDTQALANTKDLPMEDVLRGVAQVLRKQGPQLLWLTIPERVMLNRDHFRAKAQQLVDSFVTGIIPHTRAL